MARPFVAAVVFLLLALMFVLQAAAPAPGPSLARPLAATPERPLEALAPAAVEDPPVAEEAPELLPAKSDAEPACRQALEVTVEVWGGRLAEQRERSLLLTTAMLAAPGLQPLPAPQTQDAALDTILALAGVQSPGQVAEVEALVAQQWSVQLTLLEARMAWEKVTIRFLLDPAVAQLAPIDALLWDALPAQPLVQPIIVCGDVEILDVMPALEVLDYDAVRSSPGSDERCLEGARLDVVAGPIAAASVSTDGGAQAEPTIVGALEAAPVAPETPGALHGLVPQLL